MDNVALVQVDIDIEQEDPAGLGGLPREAAEPVPAWSSQPLCDGAVWWDAA